MAEINTISYPYFVEQIHQLVISYQGNQFEHSVSQFPIDYMMDLIYDESQSIETRRMACSVLKTKLKNRDQCLKQDINPKQVLARLQTLYMINSTNNKDLLKLQNSIELVLQEIFEVYFDDMQKITMFQQISQNMHKQPFSKQVKHLSFLDMLVRQMNYLSLNSELLVGQLVLYLGEILQKIQSNFFHIINNDQHSKNRTVQQQDDFCEIIAKTVQLMREIKETIDENNQDEENVAAQFMLNSKQLRTHLLNILKMQILHQQHEQQKVITIWTDNKKLNKAKVQVLNLWYDVWEFYAQPDMLQLLFTSVLTIQKSQAMDEIEQIISYCLMMLQRSCNHQDYNQIFFKMTQNLTLKLFQLASISESEYSLISDDIDYFIEINDDFCKQQELQTMKTRAGSLLANLTLAIDGYLSFVTQIALVAVRQNLTHEPKSQNEIKIWTGLLQSWGCSQQQLIQTSILILSSISDQISKRKDLNLAVQNHLKQMIPYFAPESPLSKNPLFVLRYMQMYSFYSFPHCFDHFIRHFTSQKIYEQQLSKGYQTILRYYDKKNPQMQKYVKDIANSIMLLGDQLTPLLEQQIMRNNRVIQNFKENILQKLVLWFLYSHQKCEVLKVNKLSTLIVRLLHDNMKSEIQHEPDIKPFSSQTLSSYINLIYKSLQTMHPCEQTIIQIAISHIEYLFDLQEINEQICLNFFHLGKVVTERNKFSLNDCLMLFNSLICPDIAINRKGKFMNWKFDELTLSMSLKILSQIQNWLHTIRQKSHQLTEQQNSQQEFIQQEDDVWQLLQLGEICLFQIQANKHHITKRSNIQIDELKRSSFSILDLCLGLLQNCKSLTLKSKVILLILQIVQLFPQNSLNYGFLNNLKYPNPCDVPAFQCKKYLYFLVNIMNHFMGLVNFNSELRIKILRVIIDLIYFLQNEKAQIKSFQQKIYINGDSVSHNAVQKKNKIYSSFDFRIQFNPHDSFRNLIQHYPAKEELNFLNQEQAYQGKIRDLVDKIIVNDKTRKKLTVKRNL